MKKLLFLLFGLFAAGVKAHDVTWFENPDGFNPAFFPLVSPLQIFYRLGDPNAATFPPFELFRVEPSAGEPCVVEVQVDPPQSPFLSVPNRTPAPANDVPVKIILAALPLSTNRIQTVISGQWRAVAGQDPKQCDATNWNAFFVPVDIMAAPRWQVGFDSAAKTFSILPGIIVGLQEACSLSGPWMNIGLGDKFSLDLKSREGARFYSGIRTLGGDVLGKVLDLSPQPQTNWKIDFPAGGVGTVVDAQGNFKLHALPYGDNEIRFWTMVPFSDPATGVSRNQYVGLAIPVPSTQRYTMVDMNLKAQIFPTSGCQYTPWGAIGYSKFNGSQMAIYYAGGVGAPTGVSPRDAGLELTITPPNAPSFTIPPGPRVENFMLNPAAGDWTLNAKVCGQTYPLSIRLAF